jgi:hypothetical protein
MNCIRFTGVYSKNYDDIVVNLKNILRILMTMISTCQI